jgi:hypothetical protein
MEDTKIEDFFHAHIDRALRKEGVSTAPLTERYLVGLLTGYAGQGIDDTPLALKLLGALEATPRERRLQLKEIGDTSLYVSGFWAESLERRAVDVDYYIGMGESAYGELAGGRDVRDPGTVVFADLARNFARFVRVLSCISDTVLPANTPEDVIKLYERWLKTGSHWARRRLAKLGVQLPSGATAVSQ